MFGFFSRGRKIPLHHHPGASDVSSLHEAKLAAWAIMQGEHRPSADPLHSRRHHHGMFDDLPAPEPAPRRPRRSVWAVVEAICHAAGFGRRQVVILSGESSPPVGDASVMSYIDYRGIRVSGRRAAAEAATRQVRAMTDAQIQKCI